MRSDEYRIIYNRELRKWFSEDDHEVRLRWGYGHGFSIPVPDNPIEVKLMLSTVEFDIYLSHFIGEFYIRLPRYPLPNLIVHELTIPKDHPCFSYFRKVLIKDGKEYERTLAHDKDFQLYGHDDGKLIT